MKYLKKFNEELDPGTYYSAGNKLKELGQEERGRNLIQYANKELIKRSIEKRNECREKFGVFGHLNIVVDLFKRPEFSFLPEEFEFVIQYDSHNTGDDFDGDVDKELKLNFWIGILPPDDMIEYVTNDFDIKKNPHLADSIDQGVLWVDTFKINFDIDINKFELKNVEFDGFEYGDTVIKGRKSANKFKQTLKGIFDGSLDYPSTYNDNTEQENIMESFSEMNILGDFGIEPDDIANMLQKTHINKLMKWLP